MEVTRSLSYNGSNIGTITLDVTPSSISRGSTQATFTVEVLNANITASGYSMYVTIMEAKLTDRTGAKNLASPIMVNTTGGMGSKTASLAFSGIQQPITGNRGEVNVPVLLYLSTDLFYAESGNTAAIRRIVNIQPITLTTPNVDSMLEPLVSIPASTQPGYILSPGAGFPDGWPLLSNIGGSCFANVKFDKSWVTTYAGSSVSEVYVQLQFMDGSKPLTMTSPVSMTLNGSVYSCSVKLHNNSCTSIFPIFIVVDSAGRDTDKQGPSLAVQVYRPPVVKTTIDRCDENGKFDDEGTYAKLGVSASLFNPNGVSENNKNSVVDAYATVLNSGDSYISLDLSEESTVIGGNFEISKQYKIAVMVEDITGNQGGSTAVLDVGYSTMDFLAGGKGIAFGGTSVNEGFECNMESYFEKPTHVVDSTLSVDNKTLKDITVDGGDGTYEYKPVFFVDKDGIVWAKNKVKAGSNSAKWWSEMDSNGLTICLGDYKARMALVNVDDKDNRRLEINIHDDVNNTWPNLMRLYETYTFFGKPVSIMSGGTGAKTKKDAMMGLSYLGLNPTGGSANDTRAKWQELGPGFAYFSATDMLQGQPNQYGFLISVVQGAEIHQEFWAQTNGKHYKRGVNISATTMPGWTEIFTGSESSGTYWRRIVIGNTAIMALNLTGASYNVMSTVTFPVAFSGTPWVVGNPSAMMTDTWMTISARDKTYFKYYLQRSGSTTNKAETFFIAIGLA